MKIYKARKIFHLSLLKFVIIVLLISLSTYLPNQQTATTKITWEVNRGIPFTVLTLDECRGPCTPSVFSYSGVIKSFFVLGLLLNILVICIFVFMVDYLYTSTNFRTWLNNKIGNK